MVRAASSAVVAFLAVRGIRYSQTLMQAYHMAAAMARLRLKHASYHACLCTMNLLHSNRRQEFSAFVMMFECCVGPAYWVPVLLRRLALCSMFAIVCDAVVDSGPVMQAACCVTTSSVHEACCSITLVRMLGWQCLRRVPVAAAVLSARGMAVRHSILDLCLFSERQLRSRWLPGCAGEVHHRRAARPDGQAEEHPEHVRHCPRRPR
jgi:hypothetical protein